MKTERNILIAFILNLFFAVFEFVGGFLTGSVAVFSDSIHDLGDALSIGVSFFLERKSKKKPNEKYSFGYARFSVLGSLFTTLVLMLGSCFVVYGAIKRIINPVAIDYNKMIVFAVVGVVVNFLATYFTHEGGSVNQRAVNLHMLEDVLGWLVVLIGAVIMRVTDISVLDPVMSILIAVFIFIATVKNLVNTLEIFLEKTPGNISIAEIKEHVLEIDGIKDVHHIHVWTLDGTNNFCTLHVVSGGDFVKIKQAVKEELKEHGISHSTVEIEGIEESCDEKECRIESANVANTHHHHH